jgi:hypothetical protein
LQRQLIPSRDRIAIDNDPIFPPPDGSLSLTRATIAQVGLVNQESERLLESVREESRRHRSVSECRYLSAECARLKALTERPFPAFAGADRGGETAARVGDLMRVLDALSEGGEDSLIGILTDDFPQ